MNNDLAILVIAYKRPEALRLLLSKIPKNASTCIYFALDAPRVDEDKELNSKCIETIAEWEESYPGKIHKKFATQNLGCSISVIEACKWVFESENYVTILEDDCVPSDGFFKLVADARSHIESNWDLFMVCGTQFVPSSITGNRWSISKYPMIWGWATTKSNWLLIQEFFETGNLVDLPEQKWNFTDYSYWHAGARRGLEGFVDAWDTPLAFFMQKYGLRAISPGQNLVTNIGDDVVATHTRESTVWIRTELATYQLDNSPPMQNLKLDHWLRKNFYQISLRHIVTTRVTWLLDRINVNKRKRRDLRITLSGN